MQFLPIVEWEENHLSTMDKNCVNEYKPFPNSYRPLLKLLRNWPLVCLPFPHFNNFCVTVTLFQFLCILLYCFFTSFAFRSFALFYSRVGSTGCQNSGIGFACIICSRNVIHIETGIFIFPLQQILHLHYSHFMNIGLGEAQDLIFSSESSANNSSISRSSPKLNSQLYCHKMPQVYKKTRN